MTTLRNYVFYKFVCLNDDVESCYVGSTCNFKKRRTSHKHNCHNEFCRDYNIKLYQTIRENGGWQNWKMVQFGSRDQITKREAEQIEEEYRKQLKADMNTQRAFRTEQERKEREKEYNKEYYDNNKEKLLEYQNEYRENNKEKIAEYKNEYYENNRDKIAEYQKEYRENNKEYKNEYNKEYYKNNKDKLNEKVECECGRMVSRRCLSAHKTSMIHQLKLLEIGETSE